MVSTFRKMGITSVGSAPVRIADHLIAAHVSKQLSFGRCTVYVAHLPVCLCRSVVLMHAFSIQAAQLPILLCVYALPVPVLIFSFYFFTPLLLLRFSFSLFSLPFLSFKRELLFFNVRIICNWSDLSFSAYTDIKSVRSYPTTYTTISSS